MKGFVLHFGRKGKAIRIPLHHSSRPPIKELFTRYGIQAFLITVFLMGLIVGAACSRGVGDGLSGKLDYLFVTNIKARAEMSVIEVFLSCFVPYFLFVFAAFLCAFSAWGFVAIPALTVFKGFSVGISSAVIFAVYRMAGIGFYILIVLPGTVLFLFAFIRYSREAFRLSAEFARLSVFDRMRTSSLGSVIRVFLKNSLFALLFSGVCSVVDLLLWVLFADKFHLY